MQKGVQMNSQIIFDLIRILTNNIVSTREIQRIFYFLLESNDAKVLFIVAILLAIVLYKKHHFENSFTYALTAPDIFSTIDQIQDSVKHMLKTQEDDRLMNQLEMKFSSHAGEADEKQNDLLMFMLDNKGNFIYANDKSFLAFKKTPKELLGSSIFSIYEALNYDNRDWFKTLLKQFVANNIVKIKNDTQDQWIYMKYRANLNVKGDIESIIVTGSDVTLLMKSETLKQFYTGQDQLTGLMNQYGLIEHIKKMQGTVSAVSFFIEVMHFTEIIDYYGHRIANQLLNEIVKDIQGIVSDKCSISRYTESKFVIMCFNGDSSEKNLENYKNKFAKFLSNSYKIDNLDLQIDKRIGYAVYPEDTNSIEELISLSSIALKNSITANSTEIQRYNPEMMKELKYNLELASKLKIALDNEKIQVYFQKAINCSNDEIYIIEELSRWKDDEYGYISPLEFFRVAKETNQLDRLDRYMVKKSLESFKALQKSMEFKSAKITINLSPNTLLNIKFFDYFNETVAYYGIQPSDIYIEISEGTFVNKLDLCISRINQYKDQGYLIALDDFGIEYSSLAILEKVNFDIIKIDAHFIKNINNLSNQEVIKMIRRITNITDKEMIAEGVETKEQSDKLRELGCLIQQGYYLHRPENLF